MRSHFSEAIARGTHYDSVRFDSGTRISGIDDEGARVQAWDPSDILPSPQDLSLEAPLYTVHGSNANLDGASLNAVLLLPIFTLATTVEFARTRSVWHTFLPLSHFKLARTIQFEALDDVQRFAATRSQKRLCPKLECIRLLGIKFDGVGVKSLTNLVVQLLQRTYRGRDIRIELCRCFIGTLLLKTLGAGVAPCGQ